MSYFRPADAPPVQRFRYCMNCYVRLPEAMRTHIHRIPNTNDGVTWKGYPDTAQPLPGAGRQTYESFPTVSEEEARQLFARLCEISSPAFEQEYPASKDSQ